MKSKNLVIILCCILFQELSAQNISITVDPPVSTPVTSLMMGVQSNIFPGMLSPGLNCDYCEKHCGGATCGSGNNTTQCNDGSVHRNSFDSPNDFIGYVSQLQFQSLFNPYVVHCKFYHYVPLGV